MGRHENSESDPQSSLSNQNVEDHNPGEENGSSQSSSLNPGSLPNQLNLDEESNSPDSSLPRLTPSPVFPSNEGDGNSLGIDGTDASFKCRGFCLSASVVILAITFLVATIVHLITEETGDKLVGRDLDLHRTCVGIIAATPISLLIVSFFIRCGNCETSNEENPIYRDEFIGGLTLGLGSSSFITNSILAANIVLATACLAIFIIRILILEKLSSRLFRFPCRYCPECCSYSLCTWCQKHICVSCAEKPPDQEQPHSPNFP